MKKLKVKGLKKEMSTTGTGASFAPGIGGQYATSKAFKKKRNEDWSKLRQGQLGLAKTPDVKKQIKVSEPFLTPSPSIPNRKSKAIDYVQLWGEAKEHYQKYLKYNPIKDMTDSQAWAGDNTGIDMDSLDAANVLELAKFADKKNKLKIGDVDVKDGVKYTVSDIDKTTGAIQWKVDYLPNFEKVFNEFKELRSFLNTLAKKTDDEKIDNINDDVRTLFNRYRTHVRNEYPDAYKRAFNENITEELGVAKRKLQYMLSELGNDFIIDAIMRIEDENVLDILVDAIENPRTYRLEGIINEVRYSRFKKEAKLRTPTEQIHRAVKEIRQRMNEMLKIVGHTERMKSELKQSNEGMSYLKRTRNALSNISEKLTELNNRIKGLTE
jgi:predicted transcriptional regulator